MIFWIFGAVYAKIIVQDTVMSENTIKKIINDSFNLSEAVENIIAHDKFIETCTISKKHHDTIVSIKRYPSISKIEIDTDGQLKQIIQKFLKDHHIHYRSPANKHILKNISTQLSKILNNMGYFGICVHSYIIKHDEDNVTIGFKLDHPHDYYISGVNIEGNKIFSTSKIKKHMNIAVRPFYMHIPLLNKVINTKIGRYDVKILEEDVKRIQRYYFRNGYVNAKVEYLTEIFNNKLIITFKINEGKKYILGKIKDSPIQIKNLSQVHYKTKEAKYKLQKNVTYDIDTRGNVADIRFKVKPYNSYCISRIDIKGNKRIESNFIRKIINISEGDIVYANKLKKLKKSLLDFYGIQDVDIDVQSINGENILIVTIVEDIDLMKHSIYLGINSGQNSFASLRNEGGIFRNPGVEVGWSNDNLFGKRMKIELVAMASKASHGIMCNFVNPFLSSGSKFEMSGSIYKTKSTVTKLTRIKSIKSHFDMTHILSSKYMTIAYGPKYEYLHINDTGQDKALSEFYKVDLNKTYSTLFATFGPALSFASDNMNLTIGSLLSVPVMSNKNYHSILSDKVTFNIGLMQNIFFFRAKLTMNNLIVHSGSVPAIRKISYMPHIFGFDEYEGYGPRDIKTDTLIGANKYVHLRNSLLYPIHAIGDSIGIHTSLFVSSDICINDVPEDRPYYQEKAQPKYKWGKIRSSMSFGIQFNNVPMVGEINIGFAIPIDEHKEMDQHAKCLSDSGDKLTSLVFTIGKKAI